MPSCMHESRWLYARELHRLIKEGKDASQKPFFASKKSLTHPRSIAFTRTGGITLTAQAYMWVVVRTG